MNKFLLLFFLIIISSFLHAQQSDFISFRKNNRTIKTYFKGMSIEFINPGGAYINGIIESIRNDTIYIKQYDVRMLQTHWGTQSPDTISHYNLRFHYHDITAIPKPPQAFEFIRNGTLFIISGSGYAFLHIFNGLIQKRSINFNTVAVAGAVAAVGFTMLKLRKHFYPIGTKYRIVYMKMSTP